MKILSTDFNQNMTVKNQIITRHVFDTPKDTFVKSTPSFKGAEQKAAAKTLLELSAFLTAGFVAFKKLTGGSDDLKDADLNIENNPFGDFFSKIAGQNDGKIKELEEANSKLKQENDDLKAKLNAGVNIGVNTEENAEELNSVETEEPNAVQTAGQTDETTDEGKEEVSAAGQQQTAEEEIQYVKFPPKRGIMSAEQRDLKETVTKISITPEYNEKLTEIIKEILKDKEKMSTLTLALKECNDDKEKLKAVVDEFGGNTSVSEQKISDGEDIQSADGEKSKEGSEQKADNDGENSTEIYDPISAVTLPGTTVVGSIDLSTIPSSRRPRVQRKQAVASSATIASTEGAGSSTSAGQRTASEAAAEQAAVYTTSSENTSAQNIYHYCRPGTVPDNMKKNLTDALKFFEDKYLTEMKKEAQEKGTKMDYIKWMFRKPVGYVEPQDVINEVNKCRTRGPLSRYYNIKREDVNDVANAINEDPRFKDLFTFHGATKFVERLANFKSSVPIEEQVSHGIDVLKETLELALKYDVIMELHDDVFITKDEAGEEHREIHKGTNITIPVECYTEEARRIFGTYPLKLGICRDGKHSQRALICTVYPKGIY